MSDAEPLFPAPHNALNPPAGKDRKHGRPGAGTLVVARLVWAGHVEIVPATAVWFSNDRICIEWRTRPQGQARLTWLPRSDVRPRLRFPA